MTLIEVVIAIAILAVIGTITFMALASSIQARDVLAERDFVNQSARVAMGRITRDLQLAFLHRDPTTANTYQTMFVGDDGDPQDSLWFTTLSHKRLYRDARECDQTEITYWLEDDPEVSGLHVLMRREAPRIDERPDEDGVIYPMAYKVSRFAVRYLDPRDCEFKAKWNTYDAEFADTLPRAAQVALVLMGPDPEDEDEEMEYTFATTVLLEYGGKVTCNLFGDTEQE
ncbi:MAG: general secretion pathway protein GspJ [Alphaproteobacteria bacterium]|nr:general secretion pathway protein GspJ [Alphaproteobacteria bacterium]MCB9793443.1 general secretion pathway protein GspJ [Alphaproteobacteria bacterium]